MLKKQYDSIVFTMALVFLFLSFAGTKACQEDYEFAVRTSIESPTPTPTEEGDEELMTPTATPTEDGETESTPTPTPSPARTRRPTRTATIAVSVEGGLKVTGEVKTSQSKSQGRLSNWLGNIANKSIDDDDDGFTDDLESTLGTDPNDPLSIPTKPSSNLFNRFSGIDDDLDGVLDSDELKLGLNLELKDSDGDGILDGTEILCGSDPKDARSVPTDDSDADGLTTALETSRKLDSNNADTDKDKLSDALELIYGTDPLNPDSDADGILDGKEIDMASDPVVIDEY